MKNQPLIQEVISQISQRFTPKIPDIKKVRPDLSDPLILFSIYASFTQAIDTLLEKEYIERVDGSRDAFAYVA